MSAEPHPDPSFDAAPPAPRPASASREAVPLVAWLPGPRLLARLVLGGALVVAVVLRVGLALVNADFNDSHLPVIRVIAFEHRFPGRTEAWESFQPKLWHTTVALVWRGLPTRDPLALTRAAQLVSCAAGVLTLLVALRFVRERARRGGALGFALVALGPGLVGIDVQATNDSFVILFASLALYFGARLVERWRARDLAALVVACILAGVSKGNGLVTIVAVLTALGGAFVLPALGGASRSRVAGVAAIFVAAVVPAVAFIGPYAAYQREVGTPFVTNWAPSPPPHFLRETSVERPGLTSVAHGLLTFRLVDLLRHPSSTYSRTDYPRHRTSLWSRVYAQAHSLRFEGWPMSWATESGKVRQLTRVLLVLGLFPTLVVGVGGVVLARRLVSAGWRAVRGRAAAADTAGWWAPGVLALATVLGHLAFVAVYSVRLRDFSSMKQIFVLPALLGFVVLFDEGAGWLEWRLPRGAFGTAVRGAAVLATVALLAAYTLDAAVLLRDLRAHARTAPPPSLTLREDGAITPAAGERAA